MLSNLKIWSYLSKDSEENQPTNTETINSTCTDNETLDKASVSKVTDKANEWKDYLLGASKTASTIAVKQMSSTAKNLRQNVSDLHIIERSNLLSDFTSEQLKFKSEKRTIEKKTNEVCLPWINALNSNDNCDYSEAEQQNLKVKILSVSADELNFTRNPPAGSDFEFNCGLYSPVAVMLLKEDPKLAEMRFKLVPKRIKEEIFWRNYFYRISLIKQSLQGNIDHQESSGNDDNASEVIDRNVPINAAASVGELVTDKIADIGNQMKTDDPIKSGSAVASSRQKQPQQQPIDNNDDWEAELQKELSEFELVNEDSNGKDVNDFEEKVDFDDLEKEIMNELEK